MRTLLDTLGILLNIQNAVNINEILYGIRHLPIIGRYISDRIYGIQLLKLLALMLSVISELFKAFFGRLIFFVCLFFASGAVSSLNDYSQKNAYLCGFLLLSLLAVLLHNTFRISTSAEYTVFYLGMDAARYIRSLFLYKLILVVIAYSLFGIPSALLAGVPWYLSVLLPFAGAGLRAFMLGLKMAAYSAKQARSRKKGRGIVQRPIEIHPFITGLLIFVLSIAGPVATGVILYYDLYAIPALLCILSALLILPGILLIRRFPQDLYRIALSAERDRMHITREKEKKKKNPGIAISSSAGVRSDIKGYRFLNELFLKRHRLILCGRLILNIALSAFLIALSSVFLYYELRELEDAKDSVLRFIVSRHPGVFPLILLTIHSGESMSRAWYVNCDASMLKYAFYRTRSALTTMFRLRVISVIRYNLLPAMLFSVFALVVIAITGGEEYALQYLFTVLLILCATAFFSVRHMILYYLVQPYCLNIHSRSRLYGFINFWISLACLILPFTTLSALKLSLFFLLLTVCYSLLGERLVYTFGQKTFRLK